MRRCRGGLSPAPCPPSSTPAPPTTPARPPSTPPSRRPTAASAAPTSVAPSSSTSTSTLPQCRSARVAAVCMNGGDFALDTNSKNPSKCIIRQTATGNNGCPSGYNCLPTRENSTTGNCCTGTTVTLPTLSSQAHAQRPCSIPGSLRAQLQPEAVHCQRSAPDVQRARARHQHRLQPRLHMPSIPPPF